MKLITISVLLSIALFHNSCRHKEESKLDPPTTISCGTLENGLIFGNEETIETEINELSKNYPPVPTADDEIGHKKNLDSIIVELNNQCQNFVAELGCYACVESYPPISVINLTLDSAGIEVQRGIGLRTPKNDFMTLR